MLWNTIRDTFAQQGTLLYNGRNQVKLMRLDLGDTAPTEVVVKRFMCRNIFQRIAYTFFSHSKARKAYDNAMRLIKLGINTPHPYAYVEYKSSLLLKECYYISGVDTGRDLAELLPVHGNAPYSVALADAFGAFVAQLHHQGIIHHDLNSTNVRFHTNDNEHYTFSLIDINRMRFYPANSIPLYARLENLTRFTGRCDITRYVANAYAKAYGEDPEHFTQLASRVKQRHDRRWRRRKAITHPIRTLREATNRGLK